MNCKSNTSVSQNSQKRVGGTGISQITSKFKKNQLNQFLLALVNLATDPQLTNPLFSDFKYSCIEEIVLKYGIEFSRQQLIHPVPPLSLMALNDNFSYNQGMAGSKYIYCEGFMTTEWTNCPIHHSWLYDWEQDKIIDTVFDLGGLDYRGILFNKNFLDSVSPKSYSLGLLDYEHPMSKGFTYSGIPENAFWIMKK